MLREAERAPSSALAAVAPSSTSTRGSTTRSSSDSHGLHASTSNRFGVWWMRRPPRSSNLKCLTTLVTYASGARSPPPRGAVELAAGRAHERPALSILLVYGCSPTNITRALAPPSPKTVSPAGFQRWQPRHPGRPREARAGRRARAGTERRRWARRPRPSGSLLHDPRLPQPAAREKARTGERRASVWVRCPDRFW